MDSGNSNIIDCRGLACPMPLLKAKLHWNVVPSGASYQVIADDPGARRDIPLWAARVGASLTIEDHKNDLKFTIAKPE